MVLFPRNRPGSAPPSRSRRPRPRLEHPSRRLSLRTSENAGRRRRYPRRASRGACFCSPVPTPIRTSPPRAQQRFFVSFFFARVCGSVPFFCDLSTTKGKIGIRFDQAAMDRVDRAHYSEGHQIKRGAKGHFPRRHCECLRVACHTRARARERSRRPTEHLRNRRFVCQTLAGTYGRAFSGPRRPRVDARAYHRRDSRSRATTIRGDALSSNRRSEARSGDDGLRRGRFETKGASAHRSRQDINAHIAPARSEARRLERHPSSSGAPVVVAFVVERTQPYSRRVRASSRSSKSKSISPGAPRSRRANRGGRDATTRRHDSHTFSHLSVARARASKGPKAPPVVSPVSLARPAECARRTRRET